MAVFLSVDLFESLIECYIKELYNYVHNSETSPQLFLKVLDWDLLQCKISRIVHRKSMSACCKIEKRESGSDRREERREKREERGEEREERRYHR